MAIDSTCRQSQDQILVWSFLHDMSLPLVGNQNIQEVEGRFQAYMKVIKKALGQKEHAIKVEVHQAGSE